MMFRFHRCILAVSFLLMFCSGCGESGPPSERRLSVAVIPMGTTHEFWKSIHAGAEKAAAELDVEIIWKGPQVEDDRAQQIAVVEDMIARHVNGIVLAPLDRTGLRQVVTEARRAGIPTVVVDSDLEGEEHLSFVATDNRKGGILGAQRLIEVLEGKGDIILMRVMVGAESTMDREEGFLSEIARYPDIKVLSDNQYGGVTTETAYQVGENLLNRFPDVDGIFCPNESTTFGMLRALTDAGRAGQVKFVGFDSSEKLIAALEDGRLQGLIVQNPFKMGEVGVKTVVEYVHDPTKQPEKRIDTGVTVATPENMNDPKVATLLRPPIDKYLN